MTIQQLANALACVLLLSFAVVDVAYAESPDVLSTPGEDAKKLVPPRDVQTPSPPPPAVALRSARQAIERLEYDRALELARTVSANDAPSERVESLELQAIVLLIRGRAALAQPLLEELFFLAPAFRLNDRSLPPRVTKMFEEEAARPHKRSVVLEVHPHTDDRQVFLLVAAGATSRVELACRAGVRAPYLPLATSRKKKASVFRLPHLGRFGCYAVAFDRDGLPLGRLGLPSAPVIIASRPAPPPVPVTKRWWFWTAIGGTVVAAATVTAVVLSNESSRPEADLTLSLPDSSAATVMRW